MPSFRYIVKRLLLVAGLVISVINISYADAQSEAGYEKILTSAQALANLKITPITDYRKSVVILASQLKSFAFSEGKKRSGKASLSAGLMARPGKAVDSLASMSQNADDITISDVPDLWVVQQISIAREKIEELLIMIDNGIIDAGDLQSRTALIYQALRDVLHPKI